MKQKSAVLVNTRVLAAVTFAAILTLSAVYQVTRGPIQQAEIDARAEIYQAVYPEAAAFAPVDHTQQLLARAAGVLEKAGCGSCIIDDVLAVVDPADAGGTPKGYVIAATSPSGYGGDIQAAVGITAEGVLTGCSLVSHRETAGLGSKCAEPAFTGQFAGKKAEPLVYSRTGAFSENEIDAVSGATITTGAVTEAVNAAIAFYQAQLKGV